MVLLIPSSAGVLFLDEVAVDGRVIHFTLLVATAAGVGSGLLPARQALRTSASLAPARRAMRVDPIEALRG